MDSSFRVSMLETKTNDYFSQHGTRAIIDSFNEYRSEIDRTTKTILSEHRIPEIYRTQIDFNSQLALDKLSNFEKMFRQTANDLKNDYKFLKKRGKEAKHISKIPIDENYDESSINKIISDTEKAQLLWAYSVANIAFCLFDRLLDLPVTPLERWSRRWHGRRHFQRGKIQSPAV